MVRRPSLLLAGALAGSIAVAGFLADPADEPSRAPARAGTAVEGTRNDEAVEQAETVQEHREAVAEALEDGMLGRTAVIEHLVTPGWAGERLAHASADDWEPAIATDPSDPWVYVAITRFGYPICVKGKCPDPAIVVRASADGRLQWVALSHLSEINNTPDLALATHREIAGRERPVHLASRCEAGQVLKVE